MGLVKFSQSLLCLLSQVDLGKDSNVTGVITQGSPNSHRRYTTFLISYSLDNNVWTFALERECGSRRVSIHNHGNDVFK